MGQNFSKTLISHLSLSALIPAIRFVLSFTQVMILSKYLPVETYGVWSLFLSMSVLILMFSSFNLMYASLVVLTGKEPGEQKKDIFSVGITKIAFTITVYTGFAVYMYLKQIFSLPVIGLLGAVLLFQTLNNMVFGFSKALLFLKKQVLFLLVESILIIASISISCYVLSGNIYSVMYAFLIAESLAASFGIFLMRDYIKLSKYNFKIVKKYLLIGLPLIPFAFSDMIVRSLVPFMIKLYNGFEAVAYYSVAQKIAIVSTIPIVILENIYGQYIKRSKLKAQFAGVKKTLWMFISIYLAMAVPIFIILCLFGKYFIAFVSTEKYIASYELMLLLVIVNILISLTAIFAMVFAVYNRTKIIGMIWVSVLIFYIFINQILVPRFGLMGIGYSLIISFTIGLILVITAVFKLEKSQQSELKISQQSKSEKSLQVHHTN